MAVAPAGRSSRRLWRPVAVACCLVWTLTSLAGASAARRLTGPAGDLTRPSLRTLQLNLCGSGIARCYTGRSVGVAADVIRAERPDIVTLNEVCRDDVSVLERAMPNTHRDGVVASAFEAVGDRRSDAAVRCRNGQPYGIGLLARVGSATSEHRTFTGVYPFQDANDTEDRVWLCLHAGAAFYACTTHLASTSAAVALRQCRYLLDTAIPAMRARGGQGRLVLGADLNLRSGGSSDVRSCLPPGYRHADDGARQHVVASAEFTVSSRTSITMRGTTDHPGLLVDLASG
ncbi:MAG: endonuclease/exonuclease/phosphatase family protein [Jatrophihabitantaceae bacterium]